MAVMAMATTTALMVPSHPATIFEEKTAILPAMDRAAIELLSITVADKTSTKTTMTTSTTLTMIATSTTQTTISTAMTTWTWTVDTSTMAGSTNATIETTME